MRKYYLEISNNKFWISESSQVVVWVRAPQPYNYYVGSGYGYQSNYPNNAQALVIAACSLADLNGVDFHKFDENGDNVVDAIFVVHAGPGAEENPDSTSWIWSHQWELSDTTTGCPGSYQTNDGVTVDGYSMEPELLYSIPSCITCGVFVHEFGHQLSLPDLYDRDGSTEGLGNFCLMAGGSWLTTASDPPGSWPAHLCAWGKYQLGWVTPVAVERTGVSKLENQSLTCPSVNPFAVRLMEDLGGPDWVQSGGVGEYFLVENRFRSGFDIGLPGDGLLILHCDDSRSSAQGYQNDNESHPLVGIMQADGNGGFLLPSGDRGTAADLWKSDSVGFGDATTPSSRDYAKNPTGASVYAISAAGTTMTASFWIAPVLFGRTAAYPNPFRVDRLPSWGQKVIFTYYPSDTVGLANPTPDFKVSIYNLAGERVQVLEGPGVVKAELRSAYWDLKNSRGDEVVSGMYLYVMETKEDPVQRSVGRFTVIR